ncbi:4-hydroxy-tetrahydrodipicolinate synthase [Sphingobacterium oryzagri]|uniref:4-hydroxy-tetrahydrodipicolinate synthase n=1 Tax=Sphingobacterium oryzagri TaxID=3025669 RepID=A0ABY7WLK7_9SPHI|nr:4-hydroxy-tetrahydrodipicolinate synthase [Sphingobacterium sp. KACC 22765]WDF70459.1 4-hydroxy-tetrahydrodipicolinate synthase [Sphingobacterium sp. KACC 22765]
MKELQGAGVALVTPFNADGSIDFESLGRLIDFQIDEGMNYLVSLGTTGETATLTASERKQVWEYTSTRVNGRVPLVAGIGGNNTAATVEEIAAFNFAGYCALLSVSPYYNKPTQEGIYQHYKAIAEASKLPVILYNVPGRTGSNLSPATTVRLANEFKQIVATKEASGSFAQFSEIMRDKPADFLLISGDDPITLPMMALGAVGIISVIGNAYPGLVSKLAAHCAAGRYEEARSIHNDLLKRTELCFVESNPCGIKYIMKKLGIIQTDNVRLPLVPVSAALQSAIDQELAK